MELGYGELLSSVSGVAYKEKDGGFKYGLLLGYNKFFVKYFGIRFYGNANVTQVYDKRSGDWLFRLNYGVNLDAIANFLATDYADLGAFVGLGVGGQTYFFTGQNKEALDAFESMGVKVSYTSFDVGLNVGLRTNIAKHFGIEVAARVPFIKHNLLEPKGAYVLQETYSISARLLWNY
ncbi:outer membrane beta-barrel protein [Helicobacter sp. MIT 01-3238]|uniref:outer membrane beta-barrel protein n=1 Tax=Helicobacter sp. MIT 01-3238 TaxID=398627 RepID=UPI0015F129CE|nr:outer membrane beta-barrel protein [Helicobacter sp. MIT 01-3238]